VCELGLAEALVGRTGFCIHPRAIVRRIPKMGGTKSVDLDKVRAAAPTHVILNVEENTKQTAEALARFVPNLIVTDVRRPEDNPALYRQIGAAFGREAEAEALAARFAAAWRAAREPARPERRVLYLIWRRPWMTVSRDTYISRTLAAFGLTTVPGIVEPRYPEIALDAAEVAAADWILAATEPYPFREKDLAEITAATGRPARLVDGEMTSWYGPRAVAGLRYLERFAGSL
jgi:ABC-type Fe3+-hydroxamate transport system substrate-binding protein